MTKTEKSWIIYDVGNSAFALIVMTTIMPIFFKDVASRGLDPAVSTANWGFANSLAALVLAAMAPVLGTFADYKGGKKRFFSAFLCLGLVFTLLLTSVSAGKWFWCLMIFVIARIGFSGANIFYDAFLVDVTEKDRMDWVSSNGYAWGYIGSVVPFLVVIALILMETSGTQQTGIPVFSARMAFVVVTVWWLAFSIPIMKNVRQIHFLTHKGNPFKESFGRLAGTFREIRKYRKAFLFLVAYFFYIDGVDTIITMSAVYGRDIGLGTTNLILAMLMIQIVAFPSALAYGKLSGRFSAKHMLFAGIAVFTLITFIGFFLPDLPTRNMKTLMFWILSFLVASSLGGIQALSRSVFAGLIPEERSAEFFGFYNVFGKFAAIIGPLLMGLATRMTGHSRYGVLSVLLLFILGAFFLYKSGKDR